MIFGKDTRRGRSRRISRRCQSYCVRKDIDPDQLLKLGFLQKTGSVLVPESPAPILVPIPQTPLRLGPSLSAANYGSDSAANCHHKLFRKCRQWPRIARCGKLQLSAILVLWQRTAFAKSLTAGSIKIAFGFSTTTASDLKFPQVSIARKAISRRSRHSRNAADSTCPADLRAKSAGIDPARRLDSLNRRFY